MSPVRAVLTVLAGMLALLCVGVAGVAYVAFDHATAVDRSSPDVVVDGYLRALLVDRNDIRAAELICNDAVLDAIVKFRTDLDEQQRRLNTAISVSWGELAVLEMNGGEAMVTTAIHRSAMVDGTSQSLLDHWRFQVINTDGWRVCGAERMS